MIEGVGGGSWEAVVVVAVALGRWGDCGAPVAVVLLFVAALRV